MFPPTSTSNAPAARDHVRKGVFLDRDGVIVEDRGPLRAAADIVIPVGVPAALRRLAEAGYCLVVVSNQTVIARGWLNPDEVVALQAEVQARIVAADGAKLDAFFFCPHHPRADRAEYRRSCTCRKPAPGLLIEASAALGIDLGASVMIGDRTSDVVAGRRAGCKTILLETGAHDADPIEVEGGFTAVPPDFACPTLAAAADHILAGAWT